MLIGRPASVQGPMWLYRVQIKKSSRACAMNSVEKTIALACTLLGSSAALAQDHR